MRERLPHDAWQSAWAIRPEMLPLVARALSDSLSAEDVEAALLRPEAARRSAQSSDAIAVIPLRGVITPRPSLLSLLLGGGGGLQSFRADLRAAVGSDDVGAILLDVDSPGGSTALLAETAAEIRAARRRKPITAIANTTAASAAYWLAAQADELVVTPTGQVGSIGVFGVHEDWSGFDEKLGVDTTLIAAGKYKIEGHPSQPLSDEGREAAQQTVDDYYALFLADVAKGRSVTAAQARDGFGEGRMVTAKRAVELGMADRVASYEATLAGLAKPSEGAAAAASAQAAQPPEDEPDPGARPSAEDRVRISRLVTARPHVHLGKE